MDRLQFSYFHLLPLLKGTRRLWYCAVPFLFLSFLSICILVRWTFAEQELVHVQQGADRQQQKSESVSKMRDVPTLTDSYKQVTRRQLSCTAVKSFRWTSWLVLQLVGIAAGCKMSRSAGNGTTSAPLPSFAEFFCRLGKGGIETQRCVQGGWGCSWRFFMTWEKERVLFRHGHWTQTAWATPQ